MNKRIESIRKDAGLTMEEFGKRIGLTKSAISIIESGKRNITDRVIITICREFHVSEEWLRSGTGEKYFDMSKEEEIAEFFGSLQSNDPDYKFKKRLISALAKMDDDGWLAIEKLVDAILEEKDHD